MISSLRTRPLNAAPLRPERAFVLYWMVAARRSRWNFALDRALQLAVQLGRPLVVLEPLRLEYPHASPRLHAFVLAGMADNAADFARSPVRYLPYVEPRPGAACGLLEALAARACAVVSDDWPCFFVPHMQTRAAERLDVRLEVVDGNGITRLADSEREFSSAFAFRRWFQRRAGEFLQEAPQAEPLLGCALPLAPPLAAELSSRWRFELPGPDLDGALRGLALAHRTPRVTSIEGGSQAGERKLQTFVREALGAYGQRRHVPAVSATSGLSPYVHFGHVSAHRVMHAVLEGRDPLQVGAGRPANGAREGWWGLDPAREAFLDQLVIWRELGFHFCRHRTDYRSFDSLPAWALRTLEQHWDDPRPQVYTLEQFERAATHDPIWNAAQRQLLETGTIDNYLRMLWGKKILHWSADPSAALEILLTLNDRWALDGRDPNSYSGIFWILGRFDRPWGPERPVFGQVRSMSSENTRRKLRLDPYLQRFGEPSLFARELGA